LPPFPFLRYICRMKKLRRVFFLSLFACHLSLAARGAEYNAALVADMDTGQVLFKDRADDLNYPASLTKIMTLYLTFDAVEHGRLRLDQNLIVSKTAANASPVKLGLAAGTKISVEDAIKAVAVHSANDVAVVLSENLTGDEGDFASLMTRVANEIGLSKTNFENSSGLPNEDHMSSARDIALLTMAIYKHFPQYWKYFGIKSWSYGGKTYPNSNRLLGGYPGADGMKTGFTNSAKYCLVATAKRNGHHIMSVVLGAPNKDVRAAVSRRLLDRGFATVGVEAAAPAPQPETEQYRGVEDESEEQAVYNPPRAPVKTYVAQSAQKVQTVFPVAGGGAGVQFGAFSSRGAAAAQQSRVSSALGIGTTIEPAPNGMFRVRANGLSESSAQKIKSSAAAVGIDSYVFH